MRWKNLLTTWNHQRLPTLSCDIRCRKKVASVQIRRLSFIPILSSWTFGDFAEATGFFPQRGFRECSADYLIERNSREWVRAIVIFCTSIGLEMSRVFFWYVHVFFLKCLWVCLWSKIKSAKIKKLAYVKLSLTVPRDPNHLTAAVTKTPPRKRFLTNSLQWFLHREPAATT